MTQDNGPSGIRANTPLGGDELVVPGWSAPAFDPSYVRATKTEFSGQTEGLPMVQGDISLTHVGNEMLTYWHGVRGSRAMPDSSQISPSGFRELLPYARYLSWEGAEDLRIRVFGSALSAALGHDLTGMNLLDLMVPEERDRELSTFRELHAQPCGSVAVKRSYIAGGGVRELEVLHLPVAAVSNGSDANVGYDRILGSVMMRELPDRWDGMADSRKPMDLLEHAFIDIGFGVPV
ncbi:PAS domain-containing protein [Pyruvatibacter sp. HU-CL02332]|uniref:PAS domain-containing protein n=1 Tax=Pyruvatibacter sp. HU-CL02332 TaxID=3127650 RepID=UPI0031043535